ncbi:hypothetical protein RSA3_14055 [Microbacterium testaceum]|uniref:Uncharacterized protein n=2 Tax=Microbacterium testaceum TaxID=2033 RepID=A0A147F4L8_MICTE|nr:hypothetical protein RSA3_14055 [Microbacterium testaceum]
MRWIEWSRAFDPPVPNLMRNEALNAELQQQRSELETLIARAEDYAKTSQAADLRARDAAERAEKSVARADAAAAEVGTGAQEAGFVAFEERERRAANWFRFFTVVLLAAVVGIGVDYYFFPKRLGDLDPALAIASRATIVVGLGALAAYLARQAGQHRRQAEWAAGVAVQLSSFLAFISELSGPARETVYAAFAQRVLGEPPQPKGTTSAPDVTSVPLDALLSAVAKLSK